MKITQEVVNAVTKSAVVAQPRKITAEMIAEATEQYEKEKATREAARQAKLAAWEDQKARLAAKKKQGSEFDEIRRHYGAAQEECRIFKELEDVTKRYLLESRNYTIMSHHKSILPADNYDAQMDVLGDNENEVVSRGSHKYRVVVTYNDVDGFEFFYGDTKMHFADLSEDYIAGMLTQLINTVLINASTNTVAYENGDESALRTITTAMSNILENLDQDCTRAGVIQCMDDHKLTDLSPETWINVPPDYLPLGVIDEIDDEVYSGRAYPTDDEVDENDYASVNARIMESAEDFHGFEEETSMFSNVWDINSDRLLDSDDYIDWSCETTRSHLDNPLPYCADDFNLPISTFARTLSDNLTYDLEPYEKDINADYGGYITPAALYILINGDPKLESCCYTPLFRATLTYEQFREHLANKIIKLFGEYDKNDSWAEAERQDLFELIQMSIDKAMWHGELLERNI